MLTGCVQTQWREGSGGPTQTLKTADQTMDLEETDRVSRFERLARMNGIIPPSIDQVVVPASEVPGADRPIPVIRVVFDEADFFDPGSATPRPEAATVLNTIAENMRRDVPDVRVTVLGHTDASGTETRNNGLSERRALQVLQTLVSDGVNPGQLSTVAIGDAQPIAPNSTAAGRARNRRVEFLISPSEQANFRTVSMRAINPAFLALGGNGRPAVAGPRRVAVYKPAYAGPADVSEAPLANQGGRPVVLAASGPGLIVDNVGSGEGETGSPVMAGTGSHTGETGSPVTAAGAPAGQALHP